MVINFQKSAKNLIFWDFQPIFSKLGFFGKNPAVSVISKYHPQSSCRVSETSYTPFSGTLKVPNNRSGICVPTDQPFSQAEAQLPLRTVTCLEALGSTVVFDYLLLLIIYLFFTSSLIIFIILYTINHLKNDQNDLKRSRNYRILTYFKI